jgi:hypothetical protein
MGRHNFIILFLFIAVFMAGSFAVAPPTLAMEELLVNLSTEISGADRKPLQLQAAPEQRVRILKRRKTPGAARKRRFPKLSSKYIVVIARNKKGENISQSVLLDPRLIRAEIFSPESGEIVHSEQIYRDDVDFIVDLPEDAGIHKIQFFHPRWTGTSFELDLIGETVLP